MAAQSVGIEVVEDVELDGFTQMVIQRYEAGRADGIEQGIERGIEQGIERERLRVARLIEAAAASEADRKTIEALRAVLDALDENLE